MGTFYLLKGTSVHQRPCRINCLAGTKAGTNSVLEVVMAGQRLLSEKQCRQAKPASKMYYLSDGGGFGLGVDLMVVKHGCIVFILTRLKRA